LIQDAAGNNATLTLAGVGATNSLGANKAIVIDTSSPTVSSVTSTKANGSYKQGDLIPITATFSEVVNVTGTPQLTLETGSSDAVVNYSSGTGTNTLTFNYTVAAGHSSTDLNYVDTSSLALNSGTIKDTALNDATLTLPTIGAAGSLAVNKTLVIDTTSPTIAITSTTSGVSDGSSSSDSTIALTFTTSESTSNFVVDDITVGNGALSSFTGSGTAYTATFTPSGVGACTIDVATNTFTDGASNNNTAATQFNWTYDNTAPTVSSVTSTKANGTYSAGEVIPITITFSEVVNVTGTPQLTLETGSSDAVVDYTSGTGSNTLTFNYTVATGHNSSDLDYVATTSLALNSGTIKDAALNVATLTLAIPGATNSLSNSIALVITNAPVATAQSVLVTEQIALTVTLSGTDPDGTTPSIYIIEALPTSGTLSDNDTIITDEDLPLTTSSADVVYTSTSDTATSDSFTFKVNDGTDDSTAATVSLAITGVNDVPVAVANTITVVEDASITNTNVIANDNDVDGDTLSLTAATTAGSGTVAVNADGLSVDYTPAANFNGTEVITYTVSDGTLTDETGTFTITVTAVNDAPVAVANTLSVAEDAALTSTDVIANDTDVDQNNSYSISVTASGSSNYTLSGLDLNGNVTGNDPNLTFSVGDQITFSVNAAGHPFYLKTLAGTGTNNQIGGITNNGTVNNNIVWTPTATGTYYYQCSLHSSMVGIITIVNSLSLTAVTTAGSGTVAVNADGLSVNYTPAANFNGTEIITYTVSDGTDTTNGTFTITVSAVNDAPIAVDNTLTVV
ncbi:tandem-95 repeat protein, partial [Flavobacteriaceae bacterium]|nr:tandem-95 repeat protein [Flavobacteriaceae bacterium]